MEGEIVPEFALDVITYQEGIVWQKGTLDVVYFFVLRRY